MHTFEASPPTRDLAAAEQRFYTERARLRQIRRKFLQVTMPSRTSVTLSATLFRKLAHFAPTERQRARLIATALQEHWLRMKNEVRETAMLNRIAELEDDEIADAASFQADPFAAEP